MTVLDLRSMRCPIALVTLKLTLKRELISTTNLNECSLKVLFSTEVAMQDIILFLDKKAYQYQILNDSNLFSLIINLNNHKGNP